MREFRGEQVGARGNQLQMLQRALASIGGGYDAAMGDAGRIFGGLKQGARDRSLQQSASMSQDLASRGLSGTTYSSGIQRGVNQDLSRTLQNIGGRESALFANIQSRKGLGQAGIYGMMSDIYGQDINRAWPVKEQETLFRTTSSQAKGSGVGGALGALAGGGLGALLALPTGGATAAAGGALGSSLGGGLGGLFDY